MDLYLSCNEILFVEQDDFIVRKISFGYIHRYALLYDFFCRSWYYYNILYYYYYTILYYHCIKYNLYYKNIHLPFFMKISRVLCNTVFFIFITNTFVTRRVRHYVIIFAGIISIRRRYLFIVRHCNIKTFSHFTYNMHTRQFFQLIIF